MRTIIILMLIVQSTAFQAFTLCGDDESDKLNKAFGIAVFEDDELWDDLFDDIQKRLNLNFRATDSIDKLILSAYPEDEHKILGIKYAEIKLTFNKLKLVDKNAAPDAPAQYKYIISKASINFMNKGDSVDEEVNRRFTRRMLDAQKELEKSLRSIFGEPQSIHYGLGKFRSKRNYWIWKSHVFMIEFQGGEYMLLDIFPLEEFDAKKRKGDEIVTKEFDPKTNIRTDKNGDVWLDNVPSLGQGGKDYAIPAAVERMLLYFGVTDIDMHKIAEAAKTGMGGGTSFENAVPNVTRLLTPYKLKFKTVGIFKKTTIYSSIDSGIPLIWNFEATEDYGIRVENIAKERKEVKDFAKWAKYLKKYKKLSPPPYEQRGSVSLIVGYNKISDEIAISNTSDDGEKFYWIRFDDAKNLSAKNPLYVIDKK